MNNVADKETILEMMAEFEQTQSADGEFWDAERTLGMRMARS